MTVKVGYKEFNLDGYANTDELQKLLVESYQQGRSDAIDEVTEKYVDVICEDCSKCGGHCRHDEVMNMLEQLKEQSE